MNKKVGDWKQAKAVEIVEDAISQLCALGMTSDSAASLLVVQGAVRVEDTEKRKRNAEFVASCATGSDRE